jgi:hypothetical protein
MGLERDRMSVLDRVGGPPRAGEKSGLPKRNVDLSHFPLLATREKATERRGRRSMCVIPRCGKVSRLCHNGGAC